MFNNELSIYGLVLRKGAQDSNTRQWPNDQSFFEGGGGKIKNFRMFGGKYIF